MSMFGYVKGMPDPKTYGEQQLEGAGRVLDMPLNTVQGALAYDESLLGGAAKGLLGKKDYDGMSMFSPETQAEYPRATAAAAVASDLLLDPTNLVGGGLAKKGASRFADSARGALMSSPSNYIDNFYGWSMNNAKPEGYDGRTMERLIKEDPTSIPPEHLKFYQETQKDLEFANHLLIDPLASRALRRKGLTENSPNEQKIALAKKLSGLKEWSADSISAALEMSFSPQAAMLYRTTGINKNGQNIIAKHLADYSETKDPSALKKAVAQAQYMGHILTQAGRKGEIHPSLQKLIDMSYVDGYQKYSPDEYMKSVSKQEYFVQTPEGVTESYTPPPEVVSKLFDHVTNIWTREGSLPKGAKDNVSLVVKEVDGITGDHVRDVTASRSNKLRAHVKNTFKQNNYGSFDSVSKLKDSLKSKGIAIKGSDSNGVYLSIGMKSESYTEGGINMLTYVTKDGEMTSVVSDAHNFLENFPVVGQVVGAALPKKVMAITPPITENVRDLQGAFDSGTRAFKKTTRTTPYSRRKGSTWDDKEVIQDLQAIVRAMPTEEQIRKVTGEKARGVVEATTGLGMLTGGDSEE